jgi:hypothetical protein
LSRLTCPNHTCDLANSGGCLIALLRVRQHEDVAVPSVEETETHIAFRAYSQHDLESAFSLSLD